MTLASLLVVLTPPVTPYESGRDKEWPEIEMALGTKLPGDYKEYINEFGTGRINDFLSPYNPFSENRFLNLLRQEPNQLDTLRRIRDEWGHEECPYPLYPELQGLLPWGVTGNGNVLFWSTSGPADEWTIVVSGGRNPGYEEFDEPMTNFLAKLLSRDIISDFFRSFSAREAQFTPLVIVGK